MSYNFSTKLIFGLLVLSVISQINSFAFQSQIWKIISVIFLIFSFYLDFTLTKAKIFLSSIVFCFFYLIGEVIKISNFLGKSTFYAGSVSVSDFAHYIILFIELLFLGLTVAMYFVERKTIKKHLISQFKIITPKGNFSRVISLFFLILFFVFMWFAYNQAYLRIRGELNIKIISPNGGEIWHTGNAYYIKWKYSDKDPSGLAKIFLVNQGNQDYHVLSNGYVSLSEGQYYVILPKVMPGRYKIMIKEVLQTDLKNKVIFDESDSDFDIVR